MYSVTLFSLFSPETLIRRFSPDEGLMRISRLYSALDAVAEKLDLEIERDFTLSLACGVMREHKEWEICCAEKLFRPLFLKIQRLPKGQRGDAYAKGFRMGTMHATKSLAKGLDKQIEGWLRSDPDSEFAEGFFEETQMLATDPGFDLQSVEGLEDQKRWAEGYQAGLEFRNELDGAFAGETLASRTYAAMLLFAPEINEMATVGHIHAFLGELEGLHFPYSVETFKMTCRRLGLRGKRYSVYKRSK